MAATKSLFHSDPSFCPLCGLILPLPGVKQTVVCSLCGYSQDAEVYEDHVEYTVKYFSEEKKKKYEHLGVQDAGGTGPLVERQCPKCGNEEMTYATQQTRSADEGQTVFYTCPACSFKETENS